MLARPPKSPTVLFENHAKTPISNPGLPDIVEALNIQLARDFEPAWGYSAHLTTDASFDSEAWRIVFLDDAQQAREFGYHDISMHGRPVSKVFVRSIQHAKEKISVTASHELLEMLIDPAAQLWAQADDGLLYAYEVCDAVEGVEYPIPCAGCDVQVSDFVFPSFFESWRPPGSRFDQEKMISRPFETLASGYQIVNDGLRSDERFGSRAKAWHFRTIEDRTFHRSEYRKHRARIGSRRAIASPAGSVRRSAALHYAAEYLQQMADVVDPFPDPFQVGTRQFAARSRVVDPFAGRRPFSIDEGESQDGVVDPFPGGFEV